MALHTNTPRAVRIQDVRFDPATGDFLAEVTLAGIRQMMTRQVRAAGHQSWRADQIIAALRAKAERA